MLAPQFITFGHPSFDVQDDGRDKNEMTNNSKSDCSSHDDATTAGDSYHPKCEHTEECVDGCLAYGRVCPCDARAAGKAAQEALRKLRENSTVFAAIGRDDGDDNDGECNNKIMRKIDPKEIVRFQRLGEGGFSVVRACAFKSDPDHQLAIKYIKRKVMVNRRHFEHGAADLAQEAYFLSVLDHPHIIRLHGVTAGKVEANVALGKECSFFIAIDRLYETLEKRIERWRKEEHKASRSAGGLLSRFIPSTEQKERKRKQLEERLKIALVIADALEYLHSKNIIYRDLKPDNLAFDEHGVLKLLDFGLAKELKPGEANADGRYQLTGNTGSRRYMAPEVARELPYNKSVDVYSFGILLHELLSAEKPFSGYSSGKHMSLVVMGGERPKMDSRHNAHWPINLQWIMKRCWSPHPASRPDFTSIKESLLEVLISLTDTAASVVSAATPAKEDAATSSSTKHTAGVRTKTEAPGGGFGGMLRSKRSKANSQKPQSSTCSSNAAPANPFGAECYMY